MSNSLNHVIQKDGCQFVQIKIPFRLADLLGRYFCFQ